MLFFIKTNIFTRKRDMQNKHKHLEVNQLFRVKPKQVASLSPTGLEDEGAGVDNTYIIFRMSCLSLVFGYANKNMRLSSPKVDLFIFCIRALALNFSAAEKNLPNAPCNLAVRKEGRRFRKSK